MTRHPNDFYPTPMSIVREMEARIKWHDRSLWEPCAGDFRLGQYFAKHNWRVNATDIEPRHALVKEMNFFEETLWRYSDQIITNPPFKHIREFIDHAFAIGVIRMALVCPERIWACKAGRAQFIRHRPSRFAMMDWREDYLGKGGSPDRALAVSIWDSPCADKTEFEVWSQDNQGAPGLFQ